MSGPRRRREEVLSTHGPGGLELNGVEAWKELIAGYGAAFPDLHFTIEDLIAEGDNVVSRGL